MHWRRIASRLGHDVEAVGRHPARPTLELKALNLIRERNQRAHRHVLRVEATPGLPPHESALFARLVCLDRRSLEREHCLRRSAAAGAVWAADRLIPAMPTTLTTITWI